MLFWIAVIVLPIWFVLMVGVSIYQWRRAAPGSLATTPNNLILKWLVFVGGAETLLTLETGYWWTIGTMLSSVSALVLCWPEWGGRRGSHSQTSE